MVRRMGALVAIAATGIAAMSFGLAAADTRPTLAAGDRKTLERTVTRIFESLPRPAKGYRLDRSSGSKTIEAPTSAWALATKAPAEVEAVRVYEKRVGAGEDAETVTLEVRVHINGERSLPDPLGSEGGTPESFTQEGMPCMRVSLAGVSSGRVALPLTPDEANDALTVVRVYIGAAAIEPYLADLAQGRTPEHTPWDVRPARRLSEVRTIVVEYYGPRREVERLLKKTPPAPLRALLTP
jgi:hypothetical protein